MKLKGALSQIRPTEEQRETIYGDILNKLSERPPEKEKETKIIMKKRKVITSVAAAAAVIAIAGGSVYAVSPEVREAVNSILGINREATSDYYGMYTIEPNTTNVNIDIIEEALTVTENDFTEFAEGIRAKLVGVVNCGDFAEVIVEFEFDDDIKNGDYVIFDTEIKGTYPDYLIGYSGGGIDVSDSGKAYASFLLRDTEGVPEDHVMTLEITSLDKANSERVHNTDETYGDDQSIKINGNFSADFSLGKPLSLYSAEVEPTELEWTHPYMFGAVAKMEMTGLSYSPKKICIDLRMLNDCIVDWRYGRNGSHYYNDTSMFSHSFGDSLHILDYETTVDDYIPLKFKMSDGTVKNADFGFPRSDFSNDVDKSTLITDEDWLMSSYNIPSDKPAKVSFILNGIVDYTDVEAIIFCGKEFPITERDFGINAALSEKG